MGKYIFRRIAGRLVPILIKGEKWGAESTYKLSKGAEKLRVINAIDKSATGSNKIIGQMHLSVPVKGNHAYIGQVNVRKGFRKMGIGTSLFDYAAKALSRAGKKFLRGGNLVNPAQVKIRSTGYKSKFIADKINVYDNFKHEKFLVKAKDAVKFAKPESSVNLRVSTLIKKRKK